MARVLDEGIETVRAYRPRNGATGLFLLLIGTEGETGLKARRLWHQTAEAAEATPVVVGWSRDSFMIREFTAEFLALEAVRAERSELNGDAVARREVDARIVRSAAELEERARHAFVSADWIVASAKDVILSLPRVQQIREEHSRRVTRLRGRAFKNPLRLGEEPLDLDEIYGSSKACLACHR